MVLTMFLIENLSCKYIPRNAENATAEKVKNTLLKGLSMPLFNIETCNNNSKNHRPWVIIVYSRVSFKKLKDTWRILKGIFIRVNKQQSWP